jgi:hypothetical protein
MPRHLVLLLLSGRPAVQRLRQLPRQRQHSALRDGVATYAVHGGAYSLPYLLPVPTRRVDDSVAPSWLFFVPVLYVSN